LETFVKVKVGNINTGPILVKSGLRQGDAMSPILFNIVVEKVVREMNITPQEGVKFQESSIDIGDHGGVTRQTKRFIRPAGENSTESWTSYQ